MNVKLFVVEDKPAGRCLTFSRGDFYVGRGPECRVRVDSEWVSRQHCLLRVTDDAVFLRDLGSRNGTLVNGTLLSGELLLHPNDKVQVGPLVFEVHFDLVQPAPETVNKNADTTAITEPRPADSVEVESEPAVALTEGEPRAQ